MVKQIPTKAEFDKELADAGGKVRCAPVVALTVVLVVCVSRSGMLRLARKLLVRQEASSAGAARAWRGAGGCACCVVRFARLHRRGLTSACGNRALARAL